MAEETTNVIEMIEPAPIGMNISREAWAKTPEVLRAEIIRAHRELNERIPIMKDRAAGRKSRRPGGFWELHCCERDGHPERAAELRELLAPEIARLRETEEIFEIYGPRAAAAGLSVPDYIRRFVRLEDALRSDPIEGMFQVCELIGEDPYDLAARYLAGEAA